VKTSENKKNIIMQPEFSQKSVSMIARLLTLVVGGWSAKPWFQRDMVWDIGRKQKLIDSLKKGMPFGMVWVWTHIVDGVSITEIIDGKQRCTTLVEFMNGGFRDQDGLLWSEWSDGARIRAECRLVPVQGLMLEENETEEVIVELFRRINTQSKKLTPGQLLKSCDKEDVMLFINLLFFDEIDVEGVYSLEIETFRNKWASIFCKTVFNIKMNLSRTELSFLAGMVVPLLTGKNEAITTSFDIICINGLRDTITDDMKVGFFEKMNGDGGLLDIFEAGWNENQFKKSAKGYPSFGIISPIIYLVNQDHIVKTEPDEASIDARNCSALIPSMKQFYEKLNEDEDLVIAWVDRFRKNRTIEALRLDVEFIRQTISE
jgi:hypothetical protein